MTDTIYLLAGHDAEDREQRMREHVVNSVLADAGEAGRRAAEWVGELAGRQADWRHRIVLERAAAAIGRASGREVVPGGHGELAHDLAADVITGSVSAPGLPELAVGERVALVAVCALAAAMPAAVLGDVEHKIPPLASAMDAAVAAGRAAGPGAGGA